MKVSKAYFAFPILIRKVVEIANAIVASNWFPVPNSGQIVEMLPVQIRYPQEANHNVVKDKVKSKKELGMKGL